ncbi:MAG: ribosome assembly cofactor RimP [Bacteroidales bacterium]|nr:ribosome assembly cofactor RimP [Bacteroidales bacterium]
MEEQPEFAEYFFVSVKVSGDNHIEILADTDKGITIDQCGEISSKLEELLDRDQEDFELEVSSPGLTVPLRVPRQYAKNIGNDVDIVLIDGQKLEGTLTAADSDGVTIKQTITEKVNGKRKKSVVDNTIRFDNIKTTKLKIKF